ncbi:HET-domain-containing protein [Sodiomyces alkalinus F11]|uniref:HET-domain-containing protein n=1 Tax=Sodiomyces alkalinus (strain CBS 110278 / VKM F-3762 / F11) TaxID=1314773 RepID=A0A3N2QAK4_SODAK|nr:HET-domain-containing protein [Sodiomyces alkalinus F11]ROT43781.1 HET-domain-containing protein [Sodiomyces alkalinus F11]
MPLLSQTTNNACPTCLSLLLKDDYVDNGLRIPLSELRASATSTSPCSACLLLWQAVCTGMKPPTQRPDMAYRSMRLEGRPLTYWDPLVIHVYPDRVAWGKTVQTLQLYITNDDKPTPWKLIGRGYHISEHGLSDNCVSLAREWLDMCVNTKGKHKNCPPVSIPELPTRVVFVGDHHSTAPRLVLSSPGQRAHYAALSHCWGGSTPTMTTTDNLHLYTVSLPTDQLPRTFLDAIKVARALRIEYIWIDSLCIVQDSPEDWQREASRMAQVYANAHVTISADAAADSAAGFLDAPSRQVPATFTLPYKESVGAPGPGVAHVRQRGFLAEELPFHTWTSRNEDEDEDGRDSDADSGRSKLSTRGWVFQERLLSPRTLHFARNEMAWECRSVCECECSATSLRTLRTRSVMKHFLQPPHNEGDADSNANRNGNVSSAESSWRVDIIPAYTQLDLTVQTDRLPAIAGLAQAAETLRRNDRYVAGLWRNSLRDDLLWAVSVNALGKTSRRIVGGGAPTWSWASVTGSITYHIKSGAEMDPGLSVLDVGVSAEGLRTSPVLSIRGHLIKVDLGTPWSHNMANATPDIGLTVVRDVLNMTEDIEDLAKASCHYGLIFGSSAKGNGPFGLLLRGGGDQNLISSGQPDGSRSSGVNMKTPFRRIGYVQGYRAARRIRRWGSGGWDSDSDDFFDENDHGPVFTPGGMKDEKRQRWLEGVLQGETTTLKIA